MDANTYYLELLFIFLNILQLQKLKEKVILTETLSSRKKDKKLQKKTCCKCIRINTSKCYGEDYEINRIETFVSQFKNRKLKILEKESNKKLK